MKIEYLSKDKLLEIAYSKIEDVEIVLDIGCGIMPQQIIEPIIHICCEPFLEYVNVLQEKVKQLNNCKFIILNGGWDDALRLFMENSVDTIILIDVIEHLEKDVALELLKRSEKVCRKQLAIFTPLGFLPQSHPDGIDAWGLSGGHMQEHKSGWQPKDFGEGWDIFVADGFHEFSGDGKKFDTPFGALWAIKTFEKPDINYSNLTKYNRIVKKRKRKKLQRDKLSSYLKDIKLKLKNLLKSIIFQK